MSMQTQSNQQKLFNMTHRIFKQFKFNKLLGHCKKVVSLGLSSVKINN